MLKAARKIETMKILRRYLLILTWGAEYSRRTLANDLIVAGLVTVMLIPQSLAFGLLATLPARLDVGAHEEGQGSGVPSCSC